MTAPLSWLGGETPAPPAVEQQHPPAAPTQPYRLSVHASIQLTDAPEVRHYDTDALFTPDEAQWSASFHHGRMWPITVMLSSSDGDLHAHYSVGGAWKPVPDWVPEPPDGWTDSLKVSS